MELDYTEIGKRIAKRRKELGLRQAQLSEMVDISDPYLSNIERAVSIPSTEVIMRLAIAQNDCYAEPYNKWIETLHNDKQKFMDSTRLAFAASHPKFMEYLEQHGLSMYEINYLCLYAIGLRGKEVGNYIQIKRHYIISHEIRKKLGIDEHETNIGLYIRKLMRNLEK